MNQWNWSV